MMPGPEMWRWWWRYRRAAVFERSFDTPMPCLKWLETYFLPTHVTREAAKVISYLKQGMNSQDIYKIGDFVVFVVFAQFCLWCCVPLSPWHVHRGVPFHLYWLRFLFQGREIIQTNQTIFAFGLDNTSNLILCLWVCLTLNASIHQ